MDPAGAFDRLVEAAGLDPAAGLTPSARAVLLELARADEATVDGAVELLGVVRAVGAEEGARGAVRAVPRAPRSRLPMPATGKIDPAGNSGP